MFPLGSNYPIRGPTPVTWAIIVLCGGVALLQLLQDPPFSDATLLRFGAIPALIAFDLFPWNSDSPHIVMSMVTSLFVHAGVLHVVGNMLFFHCFSQPVESLMGSWRYALFYLLCGLAGCLGHALSNPGDYRPLVGASGAVAGVLAAHAVLLPWTRIRIPSSLLGPDSYPAYGFLLMWAGLQFVQGLDTQTDVAWMAHVGGVVAGLLLAPLFSKPGVLVMAPTPDSEDSKEHGEGYKLSTAMSAALALLPVAGFGAWLVLLPAHADPRTVASARAVIGYQRLVGVVVPRQPDSGLALYRQAAEVDRYAALELGDILHEGKLLPRDQAEAVQWYKRAAGAGQPAAKLHYAVALIEADTVPRDREKGMAMLRELSRDGYHPADLELGRVLERGGDASTGGATRIEAAPPDPVAAAKAYRLACDSNADGYAERAAAGLACTRWALMRFAGKGMEADQAEARAMLERLALQGVPQAANALGLLIAMGDPQAADIDAERRPDDLQAIGWFLKAAYAGDPDAMYNAARFDEQRPSPLAMKEPARRRWYEKSAAAGNAKAKARLQAQ
jgi:membrane associated rhomboid family serine protease/TPR repeat protein